MMEESAFTHIPMPHAPEEKIRAALKPSVCAERGGVFFCCEPGRGESDPLKKFLRRWPRLYEFLLCITTTIFFYGVSAEQALRRAFPDAEDRRRKTILNLGSGTSGFDDCVINADIAPFPGVAVVADAADLPFRDNSIDMIISESMLEHIPRPETAIGEMRRVLKRDGYLYIEMPFMFPFHSSPNDYTRFTLAGLRERLPDFAELSSGARAGPITALAVQEAYILALLCSFGWRRLYQPLTHLFFVLLFPLKLLDQIFRLFPFLNHEAANHIYFFARKT